MISHLKHAIATNVCTESPKLSFSEIHAQLTGIVEHRHHAFSNVKGESELDEKRRIVAFLRVELKIAKEEMNTREKYRCMLRLENHFKVIATRTTIQAYQNYLEKLEINMDACRNFLGFRKQNIA